MSTFKMPDLGEGLQEAEIVTWHVAEGDHVVADQPLLSVETEKAVVEIPSPCSGRIRRLFVESGARVAVGAPLVDFEDASLPDAGTVAGQLAETQPHSATVADQPPTTLQRNAQTGPVRAAPAVRAQARELGVDLGRVSPTGIDGSITQADVLAAASLTVEPTSTQQDLLRGARRTMALNMARAWREVAHAGLHDWADIDTWGTDADVTMRLIRAIIAGCAVEPSLNARFDASRLSLQHNAKIDVGIAMHSPDGLFVPVLRDAAGSSPSEWRRRISHFKQGVKDRTLAPAELRDPTITLSNFGTIAGQHGMLIVLPPQVAVLGSGRISDRVVREGEKLALHRMLPLSLMFDHRVISGGEGARFLRAVIGDLECAA